jgi:hypothetical protein
VTARASRSLRNRGVSDLRGLFEGSKKGAR